jgi:hypothetical protein
MFLNITCVVGPTTGRICGILFPWTVLDIKVERAELNRPPCLTPAKLLRRHKGAQVGVIRQYCDGVPAAF